MSKLYQMNRMQYSAAAGGIFALPLLGKAIKGIGKLLKGKAASAVVATAKKVAANPAARAAAAGAAGAIGVDLLTGAGGSGGASGSWGRRRRKGITGAELRGFHKVARLLHKEGMVVKHARRGK
jgi:hypothetical protein